MARTETSGRKQGPKGALVAESAASNVLSGSTSPGLPSRARMITAVTTGKELMSRFQRGLKGSSDSLTVRPV